jgi:chemotaxis protein MotA
MIVIVGCIIVTGAVLGGFMMAGGHIQALLHPSEIVTIGGATLGAMIVMSPKKVLKDLVRNVLQTLKGNPFKRVAYEEMFKALYELFVYARRNGMLALEEHITGDPLSSSIFSKYPNLSKNHHVMEFIRSALKPIVDGQVTPEQLKVLMETELKTMEAEHHAPLGVLQKAADALPGFGIVAAVLGIVITMGAIDGPVEEIGHKVGAALVGTFLGILLSYGFFAPVAVNMEFLGIAEIGFFRTIAAAIDSFVNGMAPVVALEVARRGVNSEMRPSEEEMEQMLKGAVM